MAAWRTGLAAVGCAALLAACGSDGAASDETSPPSGATDQAVPADPAGSPDPADGAGGGADAAGDTNSDADAVLLDAMPALHPSVDGWEQATVRLVAPGAQAGLVVQVLVADTVERRAHGLMEVADLPAGSGMVFVYDEDVSGAFWMKNTLVPLDIAWVDVGGTIVATTTMVPCEADPCPIYDPYATYRTALEVPAGFLADHGVEVGWTATVSRG